MLSKISRPLAADLALLCVSLFWGIAFSTVKILLSYYSPIWLMVIRSAVAGALMLACFPKRSLNITRKTLIGGVLIGLLLFAMNGCQMIALQFMGPGRQAFIVSIYVLFVPLLLWLFKRVFPGWRTLGAAALCFIGMALLTDGGLSGRLSYGEVLSILSALCIAWQIIAIGSYAKDCDNIALTFVNFIIIVILGVPTALIFEGPLVLSANALPELFFTTVICTFVCYLLEIWAMRYAKASHAAIIMGLESVFGLAWGVAFLGELVTSKMLLGCALIFVAVFIAEFSRIFSKRAA